MKTQQSRPAQIRKFIDTYRKAQNHVKLHPENTVLLSWDGESLNSDGLKTWFMVGLHRKINQNGGTREYYRESRVDLFKDGQILTAWRQRRQNTQYGLKFHTKLFKKRFPMVEAELREKFTIDY